MMKAHGARPIEDAEYVREGGVLVQVNTGHEVGRDDQGIPSDDALEDITIDVDVPGTPDDLPYDWGVENPHPADQEILNRERQR